jgi:hypothetical protein
MWITRFALWLLRKSKGADCLAVVTKRELHSGVIAAVVEYLSQEAAALLKHSGPDDAVTLRFRVQVDD